MENSSNIFVVSDNDNELILLAQKLKLPILSEVPATPVELSEIRFYLFKQENILSLKNLGVAEKTIINVNFSSGAATHRREQGGGKNQALGKAIGLNKKPNPLVLDATAGLGKDAFVMAGLGCHVTMVERSPIVSALLQDGLNRGIEDVDVRHLIENMQLVTGNSIEYMHSELLLKNPPDVVYLDPMYPERKKSAKVKKEMQTLQQLLGHHDDLGSLLDVALACAKNRVVVKRPKGASSLSARLPTHTVESKKTRYDVYMRL
ncbi:MAG: class I SAM-dependent methyltransferase [Gammaproteobacteria bacterium]|nr:class I SAM-dependent methyltransferase [Gammaproteobacteria bacterium]